MGSAGEICDGSLAAVLVEASPIPVILDRWGKLKETTRKHPSIDVETFTYFGYPLIS